MNMRALAKKGRAGEKLGQGPNIDKLVIVRLPAEQRHAR